MYLSFQELPELASRDPNRCLRQIDSLVDRLFCEPQTVGRIFGAEQLDAICQQIGRISLEQAGAKAAAPDMDVAVYLVSRLQPSGGHTAALADTIRHVGAGRSIIVITEVCGHSDPAAIKKFFARDSRIEVRHVPTGSHLEKLRWTQDFLQRTAPGQVWLFNHHQDTVAIAAVQPGQGYQLHFYHHGDDRISLGATLSYAVHYDLSPIQFHNCRHHLGLTGNRYLPLTARDLGRVDSVGFRDRKFVSCTAARRNKVEVGYIFDYTDMIPQILLHTGGRHIHIGRLSRAGLARIRRELKRLGIAEEAFTYIPYVPSVWEALRTNSVDLYLASFPYGAGKTMVEAMGAGIPIIIHRHVLNRMIGGFDQVYDAALSWQIPTELYRILKSLNQQFLIQQSHLSRAWYERFHQEAILQRIHQEPALADEIPPLRSDYSENQLLAAMTFANDDRLGAVLRRRVYLFLRRLRALWGRRIPRS